MALAIANALFNAADVRMTKVPIAFEEEMLKALGEKIYVAGNINCADRPIMRIQGMRNREYSLPVKIWKAPNV